MSSAIRAEFRKLFTTRLWWLLAFVLAAYLAFIAVVMAWSMAVAPAEQSPPTGVELAKGVYSLMSPIGYVFPLIIGSLLFTGEFRHQTITASLLAEPRRSVLLTAKLLVSAVVGLLYGVIAAVVTVGAAAPVLAWQGDGAFLGEGEVLSVIIWSVVVFAAWSMLGTAFGGVITNQVAAIIVLLAFTQFIEPIARIALGAWDATSGVARFLPGAAADAIVGSSFFSLTGTVDLLSRGVGALVLLAYVAVFALVARFVTLRRDIG